MLKCSSATVCFRISFVLKNVYEHETNKIKKEKKYKDWNHCNLNFILTYSAYILNFNIISIWYYKKSTTFTVRK